MRAEPLARWRVLGLFALYFLIVPYLAVYVAGWLWWEILMPLLGVGYNQWNAPQRLQTVSMVITFFPGPSLLVGLVASVLWQRLTGNLRFWHPVLFVLLTIPGFYIPLIIIAAVTWRG